MSKERGLPPGTKDRTRRIQEIVEAAANQLVSDESASFEDLMAEHSELMPELGEELGELQRVVEARIEAKSRLLHGLDPTGKHRQDVFPATSRLLGMIPGYTLLDEIHRGAQGVVFKAIQQNTQRQVAIKVLQLGPFIGEPERARFKREVEVLARLRHPRIITIHDSGIADGYPYYVAEFIEGRPLDEYVSNADLVFRDLLDLFAKICDAVNAAHLHGVIHRDLKPSNIQIDSEGEPHLLDFGLAKQIVPDSSDERTQSALSHTGQFIGSIPWASPEQAAGLCLDVDMRTDVYSLGVILYHMVTREFPYSVDGSIRDVLDQILDIDPIRPSTHNADVDYELESIVLKCLRKDPGHRYQTAGQLGRDIQHYLDGEPIESELRRPSYVLRKLLVRYQKRVAAAAALAGGMLVALIVSIVFWSQAQRERHRAQLTSEVLMEMMDILDEEPGKTVQTRSVIESAAHRIDTGVELEPVRDATLRYLIGSHAYRHELLETAEAQLRKALSLIGPAPRTDSVEDLHLRCSFNLACTLYYADKLDEARSFFTETLEIQERRLGDFHPQTLATMLGLVNLQIKRNDFEDAENLALRLRKLLTDRNEDYPIEYYTAQHAYGRVCFHQGDLDEAEKVFRDAFLGRLRYFGERYGGTQSSRTRLAGVLALQDKLDEAEELLRRAKKHQAAIFGKDSLSDVLVRNELAGVLLAQNKVDEAADVIEAVLKVFQERPGTHSNTISALRNMGLMLQKRGELEEAEEYMRMAFEQSTEKLGESHLQTLLTMNAFASLLSKKEKFVEADQLLDHALRTADDVLPDTHWFLGRLRATIESVKVSSRVLTGRRR